MKEIYQSSPQLNNLLSFIGTYQLFGIIPLDIIAHLIVSIIITLIILRLTKSYLGVFLVLGTLGLVKEYYDSFSMTSTMIEHVKDMCVNFVYPLISYAISKLKRK